MDDSDQDFVDLCSKPLKRVRKKPVESRPPRKAEHQPCTQDSEGDKRRRNNRRNGDNGCKATGSQPVCTGASQHMVNGETVHSAGDAGSLAVLSAAAAGPGPRAERRLTAKDKVLNRMQQFKRASPQRMVHRFTSQPTEHEDHSGPLSEPQRQEPPEPCTSGLHLDSDEALALQLQQELDREAGQAEAVDLEDGGLFFCQICHKDMSHMTPEGRTQHLNRCLDESEESAPAPPPPPPGVPDCPICGKRFKSQKSRSAHLKRCSSDMGVSPAVLRQVLQRQAEENQAVPTGNTLAQTGGVKRKGPSKPGNPAKKKPRKKTDPLDEETMVALALSSSLLEQEREVERELQTETAVSHSSLIPALKCGTWKEEKGRCPSPSSAPNRSGCSGGPDEAAGTCFCSPPTQSFSLSPHPNPLPQQSAWLEWCCPLWQKSTLLNGSSTCLSDFYTPELKEFITPWESAMANAVSSNAGSKPDSSLQPVSEGTPVTETRASILPSSSQTAATPSAPSTPGTVQAPVGSQALRDLMELAEDGMTLTQCGYSTSGTDKNKQSSASLSTNLHLSGFVLEEAEEQADLCVSGFLPEKAHTLSEDSHRKTDQPRADEERGSHRTTGFRPEQHGEQPQLSDLQLQVDSGEVYFAHSFMVYARCPLLAEMVHESGFRVQEADMPAAQRVLMSDVPGQAVFTLLQYLYTAHCSIPASLQPHVLELASRFDLQELQQLCELHQEETDHMNQDENVNNQTDQAFMELLRSMWNEEDEEDEGTDTDGGNDEERRLEEDHKISDITSGEREICEEQVNEEELEEIYEFAATQRKREEEKDSVEEEEEEKEDDGDEVFTKLTEPTRRLSEKNPKLNSQPEPDPGLDRSYSRLFSCSWGVYEEEDPPASPSNSGAPKTHTPQSQKHQSLHKPSLELSGRTLLLSSPSVVDDLSTSPPPSTSNLPITGLSPGQVGDCGGGGDSGPDAFKLDVPEKCLPFKRESQCRRSISFPVSPTSPVKKKEPELIVLSDSSEEME
ncbi:hypothetical protein INR49_015362 [Caranx melampygus]|nr:hypothetical protein INR49_015362 [Caranx melampygus]